MSNNSKSSALSTYTDEDLKQELERRKELYEKRPKAILDLIAKAIVENGFEYTGVRAIRIWTIDPRYDHLNFKTIEVSWKLWE